MLLLIINNRLKKIKKEKTKFRKINNLYLKMLPTL